MADGKVLHASHEGVHVLRFIGDIEVTIFSLAQMLVGMEATRSPPGN